MLSSQQGSQMMCCLLTSSSTRLKMGYHSNLSDAVQEMEDYWHPKWLNAESDRTRGRHSYRTKTIKTETMQNKYYWKSLKCSLMVQLMSADVTGCVHRSPLCLLNRPNNLSSDPQHHLLSPSSISLSSISHNNVSSFHFSLALPHILTSLVLCN